MDTEFSFRLLIPSGNLLNRVDTNKELSVSLKETNYVVSPRDISELLSRGCIKELSLQFMQKETLECLLRSVPNGKGEYVYEGAQIDNRIINTGNSYSMQTFTLDRKLLGLNDLYNLLSQYNILGVAYTQPFIIKAKTDLNDESLYLLSIYIPPIIEAIPSHSLEPVLDNVNSMIDEGIDRIQLKKYDGTSVYLALGRLLEELYSIMRNNNIVIETIRDGTHRCMLANMNGTPIHVIYIRGKEIIPGGLPIPMNDVTIVSEKPKTMEERFPGYSTEFWVDLKSVGIDG